VYGFPEKETAIEKAEKLRTLYPDSRFEVSPHGYNGPSPYREGTSDDLHVCAWGVLEYRKTDSKNLPERCHGFVWF
jgi:hypothetical protein